MTSVILVQCSTNWAMKPHIGSEANLINWRRSRVRIPLKPWVFQASSFQFLKLENLLRWSFFTLIYNRSSNVWIISYILHIISLLTGDMNSINWLPGVSCLKSSLVAFGQVACCGWLSSHNLHTVFETFLSSSRNMLESGSAMQSTMRLHACTVNFTCSLF